MHHDRKLRRTITARPTQDGDGVRIKRIGGQDIQPFLDPFLMLDEIASDDSADYIGGFPPHPHRGFETLTYMIEGGFRHRDSMGNEGVIDDGGVQWMSAASGVIHSEMPEQSEGSMRGFQLWINLPAAKKMSQPQYRDVAGAEVPVTEISDGTIVRALAGHAIVNSQPVTGALSLPVSDVAITDITLPVSGPLDIELPSSHTVLVRVINGALDQGKKDDMLVFGEGERLHLVAGEEGARVIVLSGKPIQEPIAQYGPFVMNTMAEIDQAIQDYRNGQFVQREPSIA